jgi:hypothetical protein
MKAFIIPILVIASALLFQSQSQHVPARRIISGIFDGRTPCQELAVLLDEKTSPYCIKIKWRLILYKDSLTGAPAGYEMTGFVYKKQSPRIGEWKMIKGFVSDTDAVVVELVGSGRPSLYLLKADENVLFFLDENKKLMVGNRDFSYTLNRKQ